MKSDTVIVIGKSTIHHGYLNDRIYLMDLYPSDICWIVEKILDLQKVYGYSKVFVKVPQSQAEDFLNYNFEKEAEIPLFYQGKESALFLSRFFSKERRIEKEAELIKNIIEKTKNQKNMPAPPLPEGWKIKVASRNDAVDLAHLYKSIFESYPFPISDPIWIRTMIDEGTIFLMIESPKGLMAAGSAEVNTKSETAELTDLATSEAGRGHGCGLILLYELEEMVKKSGIKTAYTICRAPFEPVNLIFGKGGYKYSGTLIQNTHICGHIESMNVWYKALIKNQ